MAVLKELFEKRSKIAGEMKSFNDGINVEVTGGVAEGDMILQFIPGAVSVDDGGGMGLMPGECFDDGNGNTICNG